MVNEVYSKSNQKNKNINNRIDDKIYHTDYLSTFLFQKNN